MPEHSSRRERNRLEVIERLMQAGMQLLSAKPIADITVEELSALGRVSRKTFYNHFPSKQDLIERISERLLIAQSEENYAAAMAQCATTRERLELFLTLQGRNLSDSELLERNLIKHAMLDLSSDSERSRNKLEHSVAIFERLLTAGRELGDVNDRYSPRFLAEMLAGALNTSAIHWIHFPGYPLNGRFRDLKRLLIEIAIK